MFFDGSRVDVSVDVKYVFLPFELFEHGGGWLEVLLVGVQEKAAIAAARQDGVEDVLEVELNQ